MTPREDLDEHLNAPASTDASTDRGAEPEETVAAIREAIQELDSGSPGIPLEDFIRKFEAKHGLSGRGRGR